MAPASAAAGRDRGATRDDGRIEDFNLPEAAGVVCLIGVVATHWLELPHKLEDAPYMAALFIGLMGACLGLALLLVSGRERRLAWSAASGVSLAAIAGYLISRSVALPGLEDHVGHWLDPVGVAALALEASIVGLGVQTLRSLPSERALAAPMSFLVLGLVGAAAAGAGGGEHSHASHEGDPRFHRGYTGEYPSVGDADAPDVAKARSLVSRTKQTAWQFDTVSEARRRGYRFNSRGNLERPTFLHMRKNGVRFWGRLLDPSAPQSLVYWCPSRGECALAAYMYRAPGDSSPPTYGGLLAWHKHRPRATWMTHVWLGEGLTEALASCAPFDALRASRGIEREPYRIDFGEDPPCSDTGGTLWPFS